MRHCNARRAGLALCTLMAGGGAAAWADRLILRDGRVFDGVVVEESARDLRFQSGKATFRVARDEILRLEREAPAAAGVASTPAPGPVGRSPEEERGLALLARYRAAGAADRPELLRAAAEDAPAAQALAVFARERMAAAGAELRADDATAARGRVRRALLAARDRLRTLLVERGVAAAAGPGGAAAGRADPVAQEAGALARRIDRLANRAAECLFETAEGGLAAAPGPLAEAADAEYLLALQSAAAAEIGAARRALAAQLAAALPPERVLDEPELSPFRTEARAIAAANASCVGDLPEDLRAVLALTNDYRTALGLRPLSYEPRLGVAAAEHARDMLERGYFSHIAPDRARATVDRRAAAAGFVSDLVGENLAEGENSPAEIFDAWRDSLGHHKNLVEPRFRMVGFGRAGRFWVQVLAGAESGRPPGK
ncbi:MAG: CAP domain-containing protein [Planctomycetes bacterium]|nr:CAP domain-containing protein [Planctomycetota bacterium]